MGGHTIWLWPNFGRANIVKNLAVRKFDMYGIAQEAAAHPTPIGEKIPAAFAPWPASLTG